MLPLLNLAADGEEHSLRDAIVELAEHFHLSEEERKQMLPSGAQATFDNRVGWARTYMKKAGLLQSPRRGYFRITDRGCANPVSQMSFWLREQAPSTRGASTGAELSARGGAAPRTSRPSPTAGWERGASSLG